MWRNNLWLGPSLAMSHWGPGEASEKYGGMSDGTCSKCIPSGPSSPSESSQQGEASRYISDALSLPFLLVLELQTHPYAPEVSPHKPLFQQIPYLLSRECLQQLKLLSALSGRLMAIIKAVLSSSLLFFAELLGSRNGVVPANRNPGNPCSAIWCVLFLWLVSASSLLGAAT